MEDQLAIENQEEEIFKLIHDADIKKIILSGDLGVGKTWMARKLSEKAIKKNLFDTTLWIFLNKKYRVVEVYENIAYQLSLLDSTKEWEHDDDDDDVDDDGINDMDMEVKKVKSLTEKINTNLAEKRLLIILDDEGYKMDGDEIIEMLRPLLQNGEKIFFKVLITTRRKRVETQPIQQTNNVIDIQNLTEEESISLFKEKAAEKASAFSGIQEFPKAIAKESKGVPAVIVAIAGVLRNIKEVESCLDEAENSESYDIRYLLSRWFGMALNDDNSNDLRSCFWHCKHLLRTHRGIHFNVLIAHWMIEGYLGSVDNIAEAYWKGHRVLMKLMDRGILTIQAGNDIIMEGAALDIVDCRRHGLHATASLGLGGIIEAGLGVISMRDGMMGTSEKWKKSSILMLDGNHLSKEFPNALSRSHPKSFQQLEVIQVLVLFNPRLKSLPLPSSNMKKLRVLVIRSCHLLEKIDFFEDLALKSKKDKLKLKALTALEISGASSSLIIPDNIFHHMPKLGSLNFSSLKINSLPSSILHLGELRWLVLRGCSELTELPILKQFRKLEVLDLSGCRSLTEIQGTSLRFAKKLRMLNLSQTQIRCLPSLNGLVGLTHLLLSECSLLQTLPDLKDLTSLQILDASSSISLNEINVKSFNSRHLQILDLSKTAITVLPSTRALVNLELLDLSNASNLVVINDKSLQQLRILRVLNLSKSSIKYLPFISNLKNLQKLLLPGCKLLEKLPELEGLVQLEELDLSGCLRLEELPHVNTLVKLKKLHLSECSSLVNLPCLSDNRLLEVLDLSGCQELKVIKDESFEHMPCLQILDLSGTKIKSLPPLSSLTKLSHLKLKHCINVRDIPQLNSLSQLEVLNLCGVRVPSLELEPEFLKHLTNLQMLDLSETLIEKLLSLSNLNNLKELSLRGCSNLKTLPNLEPLKKLKFLDLSGTGITYLPPLSTLSNLRKLMLTGCSGLPNYLHLEEFVELLFIKKKLPLGISDLLHIKQLDLPAKENCSSDHPYRDHWRISNNKRPLIFVNSAIFLELLERTPNLFDTSFKRFTFSIHPVDEIDKARDLYLYGDEVVFRDIYFKSRKFSLPTDQCRYLEIRGFNNPPMHIDNILSQAAFVFLIENTFIRSLTDLGAEYIDMMKGCWIESCSKMDCVLPIKEEGKEEYLGRNLEILWISNLPSLRSIWSENLKPCSFNNLKSLYLDCCPMLTRVLFSSQLPKNLEILEIKFCEKLVSVVEDDTETAECRLQKLRILHLLELPELRSTGFDFPSLQTLKIEDCPKLRKLENSIKSSMNLETILVANVIDLRILCSDHLLAESFKMLKRLSIDSCSKLEYICSSYIRLESLEELELKFCDKLKAVFERSDIGVFPRLHTLNLWELPSLKSIARELPLLQNQTIEGCPEVQKFLLHKNSGIELP